MSHDHGHAYASQANRRRLGIALALAASYMAVEVVGGLITGSRALLADAGHMLSDVAALGLALFASWMAGRPSGRRWTYGLARIEILAALAQGVALVLVAVLVAIEAIERLGAPQAVMGAGMLMIAAGGLAVNLAGLWILSPGRKSSLNMRGAWLHVLSDALGSVGAILAGALIWAFGWSWADPAASLLIAALIVFSAWHLLRDAVDVLMEAAPRDLDPDQIEQALSELSGVAQVHDLHVWSIGSAGVSLSCHLVDENDPLNPELLSDAYLLLGDRFGIAHATIQIEPKRLAGETPQSLCAGGCPPDN